MRKKSLNIIETAIFILVIIIAFFSFFTMINKKEKEIEKEKKEFREQLNSFLFISDQTHYINLFNVKKYQIFNFKNYLDTDNNFFLLSIYYNNFKDYIDNVNYNIYFYPLNSLYLFDLLNIEYKLFIPDSSDLESINNLLYYKTEDYLKEFNIPISSNDKYLLSLYQPIIQEIIGKNIVKVNGITTILDKRVNIQPLLFTTGLLNISKVYFYFSNEEKIVCDIKNEICTKYYKNNVENKNIKLNNFIILLLEKDKVNIFNETDKISFDINYKYTRIIFEGNGYAIYPTIYFDNTVEINCFNYSNSTICFSSYLNEDDIKLIFPSFSISNISSIKQKVFSNDILFVPIGIISNNNLIITPDSSFAIDGIEKSKINLNNNVILYSSNIFFKKVFEKN